MAGLLGLIGCATACGVVSAAVALAAAVVWADEPTTTKAPTPRTTKEDDGLLLASRCDDSYFGYGGGFGVAVPV